MIESFIKRIGTANVYLIIASAVACILATEYIGFNILVSLNITVENTNPIEQYDLIYQIIAGVLLFPLIETFIFQELIIKFLLKKNLDHYLIIIFSAFAFGLTHCYSPYYILFAFFAGLVLALVYLSLVIANRNAFIIVFTIHMILNSTALMNI